MNEKHLGSSLDDFLEEEGRLAVAEAVATKRVLAFQIAKLMEEANTWTANAINGLCKSSRR